MATSKISWEQLRKEIDAGHPGIHRIKSALDVDIFIDDSASRIGIRVPVDRTYQLRDSSPLAEVKMSCVTVEGKCFIQVSTSATQLYPEFVSFINSVIERISTHPFDPESAIIEALKSWRSLLAPLAVLSEEQQLGLWGELFILRWLINSSHSINCWVGPKQEPHDFRFDNVELEIKTTRNEQRIHIISNENQLMPSLKHSLFLISLQIAPGGDMSGENLGGMVENLCHTISEKFSERESEIFETLLENTGYREEHSKYYLGNFVLRNPPRIILINEEFPRITKNGLEEIIGKESFRITDVRYRVDVEGLGFELKPETLITDILNMT